MERLELRRSLPEPPSQRALFSRPPLVERGFRQAGPTRVPDGSASSDFCQAPTMERIVSQWMGGVIVAGSKMSLHDVLDAPLSWTVSLVPLLFALPRGATRFWVTTICSVGAMTIVSHQMQPGRKLLRTLLRWRGWLYKDSGGAGGLKTSSSMELRKTVYLGVLYVLGKWVTFDWQNMGRLKLFSLQDTLPSLPVPKLRSTCEGFLESVRPLLSDDEFQHTTQIISDFASAGGQGERLQKALVEMAGKLEAGQSWIEKWWEEDFLRRRGGLPVCGNWYGLDRIDTPHVTQAERAANLISGCLRFHRLIKQERLEPLRMMGVVPLCMWQYRRLFHTCRVPGREMDSIFTATDYSETRHISVLCNEEVYVFDVIHKDGTPLSKAELTVQIKKIQEMSSQGDGCRCKQPAVGILTTEDRTTWAQCRSELLCAGGGNASSLRTVESAMIMLVLEGPSPTTLTEQANVAFLGNGCNRWFDKSIQLIVFEDGVACVNCERSWADSPVAAHLFGFMHDFESMQRHTEGGWLSSKVGNTPFRPAKKYTLGPPRRLEWRLTSKLARAIDEARSNFSKTAGLVDLVCVQMRYFGKAFIKKCQISPDAFVQMALQLAYYRLHGNLPVIVESAHTRQFSHGRTETVRIVTSDSVAFVKSMVHLDQSSAETKLHLLRRACVSHVELLKEAMNGRGIERHLLGLRAMARELSLQTEALEAPAFHMRWGMSADSCPVQRGPSGGFAGHGDVGYGVSYHIKDENMYLHVCYRHSEEERGPGSKAFSLAVEQALLDMSILCTKTAQIAQKNSLETLDWTSM